MAEKDEIVQNRDSLQIVPAPVPGNKITVLNQKLFSFSFPRLFRTRSSAYTVVVQRTAKEIQEEFCRTCTVIAVLINPFVWRRSPCRRRSGLRNTLIAFGMPIRFSVPDITKIKYVSTES